MRPVRHADIYYQALAVAYVDSYYLSQKRSRVSKHTLGGGYPTKIGELSYAVNNTAWGANNKLYFLNRRG